MIKLAGLSALCVLFSTAALSAADPCHAIDNTQWAGQSGDYHSLSLTVGEHRFGHHLSGVEYVYQKAGGGKIKDGTGVYADKCVVSGTKATFTFDHKDFLGEMKFTYVFDTTHPSVVNFDGIKLQPFEYYGIPEVVTTLHKV